ncbi:hypothetical protein E1265_12200 [Streptomyces sp. 8K308]|uniref:hypothetical protein n=1 Tax=Streptomyces sp. 8K308 TaxID=2530388 RepID=UPI0010460475|nr:hypothetical protein [Streptomyces sp. 8K308]TDC23615.1 hypothetical protein E1265_12200 [Streptomyces sp. 8K308]
MQQLRTAGEPDNALVRAFPTWLGDRARPSLAAMPEGRLAPASPFSVTVAGQAVTIPYRIYHDEPPESTVRTLAATEATVLHCLYTRHSDGRIRQRHVEQVVGSSEPWAVPFVVQLVGEYVVEILETIARDLPHLTEAGSAHQRSYGEFVAGNASFFARTERRAVSYWSRYHRRRYPAFSDYPACRLLESLRAAAADRAGLVLPRHTPGP